MIPVWVLAFVPLGVYGAARLRRDSEESVSESRLQPRLGLPGMDGRLTELWPQG